MAQQFKYVEDYLEFIAGYSNGQSGLVWITPQIKTINLARYDVKIVDSMSSHTLFGGALTDKQAELVVKLILKYKRQLTANGIDIAPVETNPQFRLPIRRIDRTKALYIEDGKMRMRFPYDQKMIDAIREFKVTSKGSAEWLAKDKVWQFGITEYNVNWLVTWANANGFSIDSEIQTMFEQVLESERTPYAIQLTQVCGTYEITNASESLQQYVDERCGNDLIKLIDASGLLGYTIEPDLLEEASHKYGTALEYIGTRRKIHLQPLSDPNLWDWVLDYAELTQRYPICVYSPGERTFDLSRFNEQDIVYFDHNGKTKSDYNPYDVKIVYAKKIPATWDFPIPMLVTTNELMHAGKKMDWINRAEKIVYWTNTIINEKI